MKFIALCLTRFAALMGASAKAHQWQPTGVRMSVTESDQTAPTKPAGKRKTARRRQGSRGGRPAVDPEKKRSVIVSSRYTPAEYESLVIKAARAGVSPSALQTSATLSKRVQSKTSAASDFELVDQLRRIGNNLNQLTRIANTSKRMPAGLVEALDQLNALMLERMSK